MVQLKKCSSCKLDKDTSLFAKCKAKHDGLQSSCKECKGKQTKKYYAVHSEELKAYNLKYKEDNKDVIKQNYIDNREQHLADKKDYYVENKDVVVQRVMNYRNMKLQTDPHFKMIQNTRCLIRNAFKRKFTTKSKKTLDILGCSFEQFKEHIEKQFDDKMNWDNQGSYWVLDHISAIGNAITNDDIVRLNHYTNFQPLEKIENIQKGKS